MTLCIRNMRAKIFGGVICIFLFIFCGIGYLFTDVTVDYIFYWITYVTVFMLPFIFAKKNSDLSKRELSYQNFLEQFITKNATAVIVLYLGAIVIELILCNKITNLFLPPSPDVLTQFRARMEEASRGGITLTVIHNLEAFLFPFYLLCLYKYRKNILKIVILYLLPIYMEYCRNSYLGRSVIFGHLAVVLGIIYVFKANWRRNLVFLLPVFALSGLIFSTYYFNIRSDNEIGITDGLLAEIGLCAGFENCKEFYSFGTGCDYLLYILNLPLPQGLKFYHGDFNFSVIFSELYLNLNRVDSGFYIFLPGAINEGIFLLGTRFFWLHSLFSSMIFLLGIRFCRSRQKILVYLYILFIISSFFARGGCVSAYPFILKQLLFMEVVLIGLYSYANLQKDADIVLADK